MKNKRVPRKPTSVECEQLAQYLATVHPDGGDNETTLQEMRFFVEDAYIAVFDNYVTTCPGYVGKVMTVVWEPGAFMYDVFTWDSRTKQICREKQESSLT